MLNQVITTECNLSSQNNNNNNNNIVVYMGLGIFQT